MSATKEAAREAVIQAAVRLVYDGMSEAGWHRVRRAVEAMEQVAPPEFRYDRVIPASLPTMAPKDF